MSDITTVTEKGQVTIPSEIRKKLGIQPKDKVRFSIVDGSVRITPMTMTLDEAFGAVEPISEPADIDEQIRQAKDDRADRLIKKLKRN